MSIVPSQLRLVASQYQVEQSQAVILSAHLQDQYGNPIHDRSIDLFVEHTDFGGNIRISTHHTNTHGEAVFEISFRNLGTCKLTAQTDGLSSPWVSIQVLPSYFPTGGPTTWPGVARSLSRLERDLSTVMGRMIATGGYPTKQDLCSELGLDYDLANERNRVSTALYRLKLWFDYLWRVLYEQSPAFGRDFGRLIQDSNGYSAWKSDPNSPYPILVNVYHLREDEIRQAWALSQMWDIFISTANQYNVHLFVAEYDRASNTYRYRQPDFWSYVNKQISSASRLGKGLLTILNRHRDLGMMLTSGDSVHMAIERADSVRKSITESLPQKFRCVKCWRNGSKVEFPTMDDLFDHIKATH